MDVQSRDFLIWAAGFFDGEGSVGIYVSKERRCLHGYRTVFSASICQTSKLCLEMMQARFGGYIGTTEHRTPNGRRWAVQHKLHLRGPDAAAFLEAIQPFLIVKAAQVAVALQYPMRSEDGRKYGNSTNPIPNEVMAERVALGERLKAMKQDEKVLALPARKAAA